VSGSGISWAICKSAPRPRQITTPAPHHSVFLQAGCPSCRPTNSVKALKATWRLKAYWTQCYGSRHHDMWRTGRLQHCLQLWGPELSVACISVFDQLTWRPRDLWWWALCSGWLHIWKQGFHLPQPPNSCGLSWTACEVCSGLTNVTVHPFIEIMA